jgi:hypothetical protein
VIEDYDGVSLFPSIHQTYRSSSLARIHPIAALALAVETRTDIPADLSLEASDCWTLYQAMTRINSDGVPPALDPTTFFANVRSNIRLADVLRYEHQLKAVYSDWLRQPASLHARRVIDHLKGESTQLAQRAEAFFDHGREKFFSQILPMLLELDREGSLPAIIFNYDRNVCELLASGILSDLSNMENRYKAGPQWQVKLREHRVWEEKKKDRERMEARRAKGAKTRDREDQEAAAQPERVWQDDFDPDAPLPQYSFCGLKHAYAKDDLDNDILGIIFDPCLASLV